MNYIRVHSVLPRFLSAEESSLSEIWGNDVCFQKGENHLITAVSGAGKSSLFSYLFGERRDFSGNVKYDDRNINSLKENEWSKIRQNNISLVFQGLRLFAELTAMENINLKNSLTNHKTQDEIMYMFECVKLIDKCNEKTSRLSFGQQQRVAIIRALCQPFDFLLLDEPFSHLDHDNIEIMTELINREVSKKNAGLLICTLGDEYMFTYHRKWKL